jgi:hypothetical protein
MAARVIADVDVHEDWRTVDRALRGIARQRAALDADEARWLREAERLRIWRPLGMVSALDYMERVLGYTPHAAHERLRVARALADLPALEAAFARGQLAFSAVRELTRVATPATEAAWVRSAIGKNVRQIEELVAGHAPGDQPGDPANPDLRRRTVRFDLSPETFARLRQAQAVLADEHGSRLDDDQLVTALCDAVLDCAPSGEPTGRAKFQIATLICGRCKQGWQEGSGVSVAIDAGAVERALCDAQHVGSIDGDQPVRATQDVPPSVVRFVWRRDGGRCQTPGCRSARGLEIHHIVGRADGGTHEPSNLRLQCSACHLALHRDTLAITGARDELVAHRPNEPKSHVGPTAPSHATMARSHAVVAHHRPNEPRSHVGPTKLDATITRAQARDALVKLGWNPAIARAAVDGACTYLGEDAALETVIREALRRCPRPTTSA